ncbi:hypothetical protein [Streptomyces sp. NPDC047014]|uniref:hypothetical protein n=1 Tax=Streptomyces sp. NPDC047014 TaxID=3155736 RepID=UPI0033C079E6
MTSSHRSPGQDATRGLLQAVSEDLGHDVGPEWQKAAVAVPRDHFLPDRIWADRDGRYRPVDRLTDAADWWSAAYALTPVVTQVNDGAEPDGPDDAWPSSSASHPSVVFRMLEGADIAPGAKVLHIGTGTGWDSGMISHRIGAADLVTVEVDHALADRAREALACLGHHPTVVCGDGRLGWGPRAPYDRVLATCSVRRVPPH